MYIVCHWFPLNFYSAKQICRAPFSFRPLRYQRSTLHLININLFCWPIGWLRGEETVNVAGFPRTKVTETGKSDDWAPNSVVKVQLHYTSLNSHIYFFIFSDEIESNQIKTTWITNIQVCALPYIYYSLCQLIWNYLSEWANFISIKVYFLDWVPSIKFCTFFPFCVNLSHQENNSTQRQSIFKRGYFINKEWITDLHDFR